MMGSGSRHMSVSSFAVFLLLVVALHGRCDAFSLPSADRRCCLPEAITTRPVTGIQKSRLMASDGNYGDDTNMQWERPDPEILLSARDNTTQQLGIAAIVTGLTAGTALSVNILDSLETILPTSIYDPFYTILPVVLGSAITSAGIAHFAIEDTFTAFVPPLGTWGGLWQVPAPGAKKLGITYEQYHNRWTGITEIGGGLLLILGRFGVIVLSAKEDPSLVDGLHVPAALLFLLVAAVTPANTYMFTHDPDIPRIPPLPYPWGHAARGAVQCFLLAVFWKWATTGL